MVPILGYEGYYSVTRCGKVWSERRKKFLAFGSCSSGQYFSVCLCLKGKTKGFSVHRLVAEAYIPNPEGKPQVNHIDGNKKNNSVENLEWVTGSENVKHAIKTGLFVAPSSTQFKAGFDPRRSAPRLLSEDQVRSIRKRHESGESFRSISMDFTIDESSIRRCCKRQSYKDII